MADRSGDWYAQAGRDLEQAAASMEAERHEWACFAAHLAADKGPQGAQACPRHREPGISLTRLWVAVPADWIPVPPPPEGLEDRLRLLDAFYIPTRYPDSYPEGTPGEHFDRLQSEQALAHASVFIHWIGAALTEIRCGD